MTSGNTFKINLISPNIQDANILLNNLEYKNNANEQRSLIIHYWNWIYDLNKSFDNQIKIIFQKFKDYKNNDNLTFIHNECLVAICDETETKKILNKFNEEIEDKDYMPLTLFLNKKKCNINFSDYPEIDPRTIHFEKKTK